MGAGERAQAPHPSALGETCELSRASRLRATFDEVDAVVEDMLWPVRQRQLRQVLHAQRYLEARERIVGVIEDLSGEISER